MHTYAKKEGMSKQTTVKDIAKALGVHHTTVSRALRNHPDVNASTRETVHEIAAQMNYVPNSFASSLRNNQRKVIGLIVPDIRPHFFAQTIHYFTNIAFEAGYTVMICQSNEDGTQEIENVRVLMQNRVAGVFASISQKTDNFDHFIQLEKQGIPLVFFDRLPQGQSFSIVETNNYQGSYDLTKYLISKNKRKIAFYAGYKGISVFEERLCGYRNALENSGLDLDDSLVFYGGIEEQDGSRTAEELIQKGAFPDAVICAVDKVALGMLFTFHKYNIRVPDDISVAGFDNDPAGAVTYPGLTTIAQPMGGIARDGFDLLLSKIEGKETVQKEKIKMELIIRGTT